MNAFDIAVIGAGPGGYTAAIRAAQGGASVVLVNEGEIGGTCLNRGCIPTKALHATARLLDRTKRAEEHGISFDGIRFDYGKAATRKNDVVRKLVKGVEQLLKGNGVTVLRGKGCLKGKGEFGVVTEGGEKTLFARSIVLATGSVPVVPKTVPVDRKNILTSDEILAIKELPESLLIIGGGYIGCEFASIFSMFGCRVAVVEQLPRILFRSDKHAGRDVEKAFREGGVDLRVGVDALSFEIRDGGVIVGLSNGAAVDVEKVLVAVGRRPRIEGLGLEAAGVRVDCGAIVVDEGMRTTAPGIYAIGDVTGGIQLAHVASYQAEVAVKNALGGDCRADYGVVPSCVFTVPEIAQVGLTEDLCKEKSLNFEVGRFAYQASGKALCDGEATGSVKVLSDRGDGRILGVTVIGEGASSLISEAALAMGRGVTARELGAVIHAHPTLPEMLKEAAEDVDGVAVHRIGRRRS